jgi:predicted ATP-dependent endonuclease of OLD family
MILKKLYVRFYKSFNYDYLRIDRSQAKDWELIQWTEDEPLWYPYIEIPIDSKVTTIVGANESGKSHLLSAIEKGITGKKIKREDFCRYSYFFTVTKGERRFPDFGFEWSQLSGEEQSEIRNIAGIPTDIKCDTFLMFRSNKDNVTIYDVQNFHSFEIPEDKQEVLSQILPRILKIEQKIALPDSVPLQKIIDIAENGGQSSSKKTTSGLEQWQLDRIYQLLDSIAKKDRIHLEKGHDAGIRHKYGEPIPMLSPSDFYKIDLEYSDEVEAYNKLHQLLTTDGMTKKEREQREEECKLAYKLICKIANVDTSSLQDLIDYTFTLGQEGFLGGILDRINKNLSERLNFPSWWVQDEEFQLVVSISNYNLKFAIKDKTGTTYSFVERSQGLKHFLSYYIQYQSHQPPQNRQEILLMDEPDAFLSSQAQQDLMKIFKAFAEGKDQRKPVQVIFVTHSPFLIDKNHPDRIRVLEKGTEEQGTRIVANIARNHYEPLRSSVGSLVGETAYIGNCNLIVSRLSDQVIITGLATYLNLRDIPDSETLDLNHITIVPAGETAQIPFLIRLLRGGILRQNSEIPEQPAMIVFLNGDDVGNKVRETILVEEQKYYTSLKEDFVIQTNQIVKPKDNKSWSGLENKIPIELEDLIPLSLALEAVHLYQKEMFPSIPISNELTIDNVRSNWEAQLSLFENLQVYLKKFNIDLERLGFAKFIIDVVKNNKSNYSSEKEQLIHNFKILFKELNHLKMNANINFSQEKISQKVELFVKRFKMDNPENAERNKVEQLFKAIEEVLDNTEKSDQTRNAIYELREHYKTESNPLSQIENYKHDFLENLDKKVKFPSSQQNNSNKNIEDTKTMKKTPPKGFKQQIPPKR